MTVLVWLLQQFSVWHNLLKKNMFGAFLGDFCISAFVNYQELKRCLAVVAMPRTQA